MTMKTGLITFNVRERGRQHRGQPRNFDTSALAQVVNGPETQERVAKRDLVGYFGHWPRVMFGLNPGEGGIYDGKQITLEPALVTTTLRASPDGTIEHEAEFLDTVPGRTAKRLFSSKAGGFSSAINVREAGGLDVPVGFHGFDYVMEPNFSTNRGYALDGVYCALDGVFERPGLVLDDAARESQATLKVLDGLYSSLQASHERQAEAMQRVMAENAELVDLLAKRSAEDRVEARRRLSRLDDTSSFTRPQKAAARMDSTLTRLARDFATVELVQRVPLEDSTESESRGLAGVVQALAAQIFRR